MADFLTAYNTVLAPDEGGYRNVSYDAGGETYRGIARNYWPSWKGWQYIDNYKAANGAISTGTVFPSLESLVQQFYRDNFWSRIQGDEITSQAVANMVLDFTVQSGKGPEQINEALGLPATNSITADTVTAMNANPTEAFDQIKAQRLQYYQDLNQEGLVSDNDIQGILARVQRIAGPAAAAAGIGLAVVGLALFFCSCLNENSSCISSATCFSNTAQTQSLT